MNFLRRLIARLLGDPMMINVSNGEAVRFAVNPHTLRARYVAKLDRDFLTKPTYHYTNYGIPKCSHCGSSSMEPRDDEDDSNDNNPDPMTLDDPLVPLPDGEQDITVYE